MTDKHNGLIGGISGAIAGAIGILGSFGVTDGGHAATEVVFTALFGAFFAFWFSIFGGIVFGRVANKYDENPVYFSIIGGILFAVVAGIVFSCCFITLIIAYSLTRG